MTEAPKPQVSQEAQAPQQLDLVAERTRLVDGAKNYMPHHLIDSIMSFNAYALSLSREQRGGSLRDVLYANHQTGLSAVAAMGTLEDGEGITDAIKKDFEVGKGYTYTFFKDRVAALEAEAIAEEREQGKKKEDPDRNTGMYP